ncbi:MAG: hypothetical protein KDA90_20070 [Planctomycetaceae bacterium]|nr:hypothetical protein [Planctomycetaceae bacterium]
MSEHAVAEHSTPVDEPLFSRDELRQFEADDAEAGSAIGQMLSLFFLYTIVVMTISTLVTIWWIRLGV